MAVVGMELVEWAAGLAGGDAVDVEGRQVEEFEEMFAGAVGAAEG